MKKVYIALLLVISAMPAFAQFGIKAGMNLTDEISSLRPTDIFNGFSRDYLAGYQLGITYQWLPKGKGWGADISLQLSQKGFAFSDSTDNHLSEGYKEINYVEVPLNARYQFRLGPLAAFGFGGIYAGYALNAKFANETDNVTTNIQFSNTEDRLDYGYNLGVGLEFFRKLQLEASWIQGLKNVSGTDDVFSANRVISFNLVYLF